MKAILYHTYGPPDVLEYAEVEKPTPGDAQVLIEVHAASLNALDSHLRSADALPIRLAAGLFKPKEHRLGHDLAGRIAGVGRNVTRFQPGDEVFGTGIGSFAGYACAGEDAVVSKPATITFEAAATAPIAALTALQGLRDHGQIQPGQNVLIQGASGGVGSFAVQIAKSFGAEVTAVCSTRNLAMARSMGADHVMDYTQEDFTRNPQQYDLILAVNGYHPIWALRRALNPAGVCVLVGASSTHLFQAVLQAKILGPMLSRRGGQKMGFMGMAEMNQKDLDTVKELLEAGKIVPVINRSYPLREVAEAFRYMEQAHARGKVGVSVEQSDRA